MDTSLHLPKYVTEKLKCDLCHGYLSVPPISSHGEKFSCGRCDPGWSRNTIFEQLAQFSVFPCTYCEQSYPWGMVESHELACGQNIILCPARYEKNFKISEIPKSSYGMYHKSCQNSAITCPFDCCESKYEVKEICKHFNKYHKEYVFANKVEARKILKEEKVWNFKADTQVCLIIFNQMPFLLFIHSDCLFEDTTGEIISYDYYFSTFTLCQEKCDVRYAVTLNLNSDSESSTFTMKNQEIKPFNNTLHCINYLRIGLLKYNSFNFMTTKFEKLKRCDDLKLSYTVKILDGADTVPKTYPPKEKLFAEMEGFAKNFECPICKDYMCAPIFNCTTGHSVCKSCKERMSVCPFCQALIVNSRNFVLEDILETLEVSCQNESKGCTFIGRVQDIKMHEVMCLYN